MGWRREKLVGELTRARIVKLRSRMVFLLFDLLPGGSGSGSPPLRHPEDLQEPS